MQMLFEGFDEETKEGMYLDVCELECVACDETMTIWIRVENYRFAIFHPK